MDVLGLGHDVVDVAAFDEQLAEPGSRMRGLFSVRELRQAAARARAKHDGEAVHLAARWAGKEAVLKAWEEALGERPSPYTLDDFPWNRIEILDDGRGRPHVVLDSEVERTLHVSLGRGDGSSDSFDDTIAAAASFPAREMDDLLSWRVSLSHDGPVASAVVILAAERS